MVRFPQAAQVEYTFTAHRTTSIRRATYVVRFQRLKSFLDSWKCEVGESVGIRLLSTEESETGWVVAMRLGIRVNINVSNRFHAYH
jgi:hypothetical protein